MEEATGMNLLGQGFYDLNALSSGLVNHYGDGTKSYGSQDDAGDPDGDGSDGGQAGNGQPGAGVGVGAGGNGVIRADTTVKMIETRFYSDDEIRQMKERRDRDPLQKQLDEIARRRMMEDVGWLMYQIHGSHDAFHNLSDFFAGWGDRISGDGSDRATPQHSGGGNTHQLPPGAIISNNGGSIAVPLPETNPP